MAWFDYDEIEEVLDFVVPDVFRMFMDTAEAHSLPIAEFEFYDNTQSLIDGNWQMRLNWEGWKGSYLALGTGDGSGNYDFILARSEDDDEIYLMSHNPPGIERRGTATEFFREVWHVLSSRSKTGKRERYFRLR